MQVAENNCRIAKHLEWKIDVFDDLDGYERLFNKHSSSTPRFGQLHTVASCWPIITMGPSSIAVGPFCYAPRNFVFVVFFKKERTKRLSVNILNSYK